MKIKFWISGAALFAILVIAATPMHSQIFTTLVNFDGDNGSLPYLMTLVQGADGYFYGTTETGGANNVGTVFKVASDGTLKTVYSFCREVACGVLPNGGLVLGTDGHFYGTTYANGTGGCCGTVFRMTPGGTLTSLPFGVSNGAFPVARLTQGRNGAFFGTTATGGASNEDVVYKLTPSGDLIALHSFNFYIDGDILYGTLLLANDGKLYGTTYSGGANNGGQGTVFRITSDGALTTLHTFEVSDGATPYAGLIQGADGNFYGTTIGGGEGWGTVFRMTSDGTVTTLHNFNLSDGGEPISELIQATDGNFYGTTYYGGDLSCAAPYGCGTIFQLTSTGVFTVLHRFENTDGSVPTGGLFQATNGTLYGTTWQGGNDNDGTVYSLDMGLSPFVTFVHAAGKVGQTGGILGQGFTGTTSVSLNGTSAAFAVVSDTFMRATVPPGATTGYVTVTTPSGTLTSNVPFHVIP